mmetsp:Transcript_15474/g.29859  ORF Transcript_15474/g.29859 Transcript_15474/m.29859 type:complete len:86 (+) Transcript_15474:391-648(+)
MVEQTPACYSAGLQKLQKLGVDILNAMSWLVSHSLCTLYDKLDLVAKHYTATAELSATVVARLQFGMPEPGMYSQWKPKGTLSEI